MHIILMIPAIISIVYLDQYFEATFLKLFVENDLCDFVAVSHSDEFNRLRIKKANRILYLLPLIIIIKQKLAYLTLIVCAYGFLFKSPYWKVKRHALKEQALMRLQFPIWLRQMQILLYHNNVLNAFIISLEDAPEMIRPQLHQLIERLKVQPHDYQAYLMFMNEYQITEVNRTMKLFYQLQNHDQNESRQQLSAIIDSTSNWLRAERNQNYRSKTHKSEWIGLLPLFGLTIVFLAIMFNLLNTLLQKGGI